MRPAPAVFAWKGRLRLRPRPPGDRVELEGAGLDTGNGHVVSASLVDGPLAGLRVDVDFVEGRPPVTIDVATQDGSACRYCLEALKQGGSSALYAFVSRV